MRKLLWVGDAVVGTGFARATHNTLEVLRETWDVCVLGINFNGDPDHGYPYPIYPAGYRGDGIGGSRLGDICSRFEPDLIVLQNDVWHIPHYMKCLRTAEISTPVVAALAVDGKNCQGHKLQGISLAIFWTKFAEREAFLGGYLGPSAVVPLGVDLEIYKLSRLEHITPIREHSRTLFKKLPDTKIDIDGFCKGFVVMNVNRNQQRKRLDLTVEYFCEWVREKNISDAYLMIQAAPTGEQEYDVEQLMDYYGLGDRLFLIYPELGRGISEYDLAWTYRCANVGLTTTQGEGFGLTTFEMMALGIPVIVPAWSALDELCEDAAIKIPCTSTATTQGGINVIGGIADKRLAIDALDRLYRDPSLRDEHARRGWELVRQDRYRWRSVGEAFRDAIDTTLFPIAHQVEDQNVGVQA